MLIEDDDIINYVILFGAVKWSFYLTEVWIKKLYLIKLYSQELHAYELIILKS